MVAIDWADQKHAWALQKPGSLERETGTIGHTPEAKGVWAAELRLRFGGQPIAVALEQFRGPLVFTLSKYVTHSVLIPPLMVRTADLMWRTRYTVIKSDSAVWTSQYASYDMPYSMMRAGKGDRFAIGTKSNQRLLFGYVFSNGNGTWSVERAGKKLRGVYASIHDAAKALIAFPPTARATH